MSILQKEKEKQKRIKREIRTFKRTIKKKEVNYRICEKIKDFFFVFNRTIRN